ncbi:MAG: glycosyltransferase family 2 protein [Chloroflexota bacterium]
MTFITLFVATALMVLALTAVLNILTLPRLTRPAVAPPIRRVSILIPARNEEAVIGQTLTRLLGQCYPFTELLILDDNSTDNTAVSIQQAAQQDGRVRLLSGQPLPDGWLGKNWACHQLAQAASGDLLIFTDADVGWQPEALTALVAQLEQEQADLLSVWPTQQTVTWGERLVVPLMALAILGYLPLLAVHYLPWSIFAAANGQCMAFRRRAYEAVGGHAAVRQNVVEDVALARCVKQTGLRLRLSDGAGLITCRMYRNWTEVKAGFAKNILAGHGRSVPFLLLSTLFHWLVFVLPWLMLLFPSARQMGWGWLWLLSVGVRSGTAVATRQRPQDALFMPLSVLLMTVIAAQSIWWNYSGGPLWKGRKIT